jgi:hypothetical protein
MATMGLPSLPYGQAGSGFWGQKTSTLNFCEEVSLRRCLSHADHMAGLQLTIHQDYVLSHYCAELCNVSLYITVPC